ncbi:MAG TPA: hypothetical protein VFW63_08755 [Acidimicrobiales bacterium]|nr:hypothetical protein [Acidimicrobiales bacterium]
MAVPEYVPLPAIKHVRSYESPPWRPEQWRPERPGDEETADGFDRGPRVGAPGPDQGYVYVLARRFRGRLALAPDEDEDDALAGAVAVALKRASIFGRAPVQDDLTVALTLWGFLGDAPPDLIAYRQPLFAAVANPRHYAEQRRIVDLVPDDVLRMSPQQVADARRADWRKLLSV